MFAYKAVVEVHSKVNLWLSINRYTGARYFFSRFEFRTLFHFGGICTQIIFYFQLDYIWCFIRQLLVE